jgi:hypothetical protein
LPQFFHDQAHFSVFLGLVGLDPIHLFPQLPDDPILDFDLLFELKASFVKQFTFVLKALAAGTNDVSCLMS